MKIEMSPHAVTTRIKKAGELRRLCIDLGGDRLKERLRNERIHETVPIELRNSADKEESGAKVF